MKSFAKSNHRRLLCILLALLLILVFSVSRTTLVHALPLSTASGGFYSYTELGSSQSTPQVYYYGSPLSSSSNYIWSSDDTSIISFGTTNRQYTANIIGDTRVTVSYNGDATTYDAKVRRMTGFAERPKATGIPALNLGSGVSVNGFRTSSDSTPLANKTVTFHTGYDQICSALTDSSGNAACTSVLPYYSYVEVRFAGDDVYAPSYKASAE